ncbi:hypothetical protein WN51_14033 [Melipona quadrifasciata]|uniref:Uncharacterized protein n=1 Tax=Melipona quadrifasciata TaxID=166423 RepID=A0A0M8ZYY3_9HYME|nr:hypothetical protein WN51_14033 [Melipona quadrifasciata]
MGRILNEKNFGQIGFLLAYERCFSQRYSKSEFDLLAVNDEYTGHAREVITIYKIFKLNFIVTKSEFDLLAVNDEYTGHAREITYESSLFGALTGGETCICLILTLELPTTETLKPSETLKGMCKDAADVVTGLKTQTEIVSKAENITEQIVHSIDGRNAQRNAA